MTSLINLVQHSERVKVVLSFQKVGGHTSDLMICARDLTSSCFPVSYLGFSIVF